MLGDSSVLGSSGDATPSVPPSLLPHPHDAASDAGGAAASNSAEEDRGRGGEEGDRNFGGNRWPRPETLALLKIRSDMEVAFRDASVKGPLWEEVSRKLSELGYHRSSKKCKEKFENVYKYHKRTKEGRSGKPEGKTYRFFDQLEAMQSQCPSLQSLSSSQQPRPQGPMPSATMAAAITVANPQAVSQSSTVPSMAAHHLVGMSQTIPSFQHSNPAILPPPPQPNPTHNPFQTAFSSTFPNLAADLISNSTSSSTSSDEELESRRRRKRKWKDFFERLMKEVIHKQEELQKKFLEAVEKREHERMVREEAWRIQEMAKINREREILAQERSMAAAKDAAIMSFLQKISEQQSPNPGQILNFNLPTFQPLPAAPPPFSQSPVAPPRPTQVPAIPSGPPGQQLVQRVATESLELTTKTDNGDNYASASSSRWPKVEVEALISLRTNLDSKYQESGPKGPLWEEISAAMRKLGYNRNAKRCKEKWENINKYFKKVKESNKKRPEDSKTCPYFHQLDALYKVKNKFDNSLSHLFRPDSSMVPLMVRPEQQWPPQTRPDSGNEDIESEPMDQNPEDDDKDGEDEEEEHESGGNYELVASKPDSVSAAG